MNSQQKFACNIMLLSLTLLCAVSVSLAQVEIANPTSGQTIGGIIAIQATKTDAVHGWISYKIEGPGQSGNFTVAVVGPFRFDWDSNSRDADGKAVFPDGEYTVTAVAHLPSGRKVGQDSVRVTLQNDLPSGEKPTSIKLVADYKRGREMSVEATGRSRAKLVEHDDINQKIVELYSGLLTAEWRERAMSNSAGRSAIVRKYFDKGYTSFQGTKPSNLRRVGDIFTMIIKSDASSAPKHKGDPTFDMGELYLKLPDRTLREGSTWKSPMYVLPMLRAERRRVTAKHRLDGFQMVAGYKCARIISTYSENDVKLRVHMGASAAPVAGRGGAGPDMGMGLDFPGAPMPGPYPAGPPGGGMPPGAGEAGAGPSASKSASVSAPAVTEVKTSYKGSRISYFAYELGQFVRCQDIITHKLTIDSSQFGGVSRSGGAGGEMMDMPMPGEPMGGPGGPPLADYDALTAGDSEDRDWVRRQAGTQPKKEVKKEFEAEAEITLTIIKSG